ncbi:uncharacterized protein RSE6_00774 [Rhynchosporium secalis]|uniref:Accumulation-associated protein n=1 Tax=Rhynchosporium secalis TaxID=38038 RepID=A0A1E1LW40_RHYSE|nr:uncharacterized protein RSE6_00774 [Rhynchosporium secalis]
MRFSSIILIGVQVSSILALPAHSVRRNQANAVAQQQKAEPAKVEVGKAQEQNAAMPAKAAPANIEGGKANETAVAKPAEEAASGEEEKLAGEKELEAAFGVAVALEGGDIKQDAVFTPSAIGKFEFEFQGPVADELTVIENKIPAAPPARFVAIEPSSYQVALGVSKGAGLTLSKIDYIFDPANAALAAMDLTKARVGKLCADTGSFVIEETLGEIEFEAEENEVTLSLNKAVTAEGEWGIFLPVAAAGGAAAGGAADNAAKPKEEEAKKEEAAEQAESPQNGEAAKAKEAAAKVKEEAAKKAGEGATKAGDAAPAQTVDLNALIDALRQGKATVPVFVAPARL